MASLSCDVPASILAELSRRTHGSHDLSSLVASALAEYLGTSLHTLFQSSTSGFLVQGFYSDAVTCATVLKHGDFGLGTFAGLDGEMAALAALTPIIARNGRSAMADHILQAIREAKTCRKQLEGCSDLTCRLLWVLLALSRWPRV